MTEATVALKMDKVGFHGAGVARECSISGAQISDSCFSFPPYLRSFHVVCPPYRDAFMSFNRVQ